MTSYKPNATEAAWIRELAAILDDTGLTEIEIQKADMRVRVSRANGAAVAYAAPMAAAPAPQPTSAEEVEAAPVVADSPSPPTTAEPAPTVVALFGDSVADWLVRDAAASFARDDVTLVDAAVEGCDGALGLPDGRGRAGELLAPPEDCREWRDAYPEVVENPALGVDVAVLVVGYAPLVDRLVGGAWVAPCVDLSWYVDDVGGRIAYLRRHVGEVVLALPSWGGSKASFLSSDDHLERTSCIRDALASLATERGVAVVDLASLLCPAGPRGECNDLRAGDGAHVDPEDAPQVLDWLLDAVLAA